MQARNLFADEKRAVSPVIGVILMVAITVILAAVVGSFALGLGDETDDVQPNVALTTDQNGTSSFTMTVESADSDADPSNFLVQVQRGPNDNFDKSTSWDTDDGSWATSGDDLSAGDSFEIDLTNTQDGGAAFGNNDDDELEVTVVFETDATSSVVEEYTVTPE